jgi:hypothetical protein
MYDVNVNMSVTFDVGVLKISVSETDSVYIISYEVGYSCGCQKGQ